MARSDSPGEVASSAQLGLVERLRSRAWEHRHHRKYREEAATEIERLRLALQTMREYPDFDDGGPLAEMMDQVLRGARAPMLEKLVEWQRLYGHEA